MPYDFELKIEWADQRINELERILDEWANANRYALGVKVDPETGEKTYYPKIVPEIPPEFSLRAGEIIQHLRSALDYLVCAAVSANGGDPENAAFPVFKQWPLTNDQQSAFERKVAGARQEFIQYIYDLKPYKGGNPSLWKLHALNNRDKHKLLILFHPSVRDFNFGQHLRATREGQAFGATSKDFMITPSKAFRVEAGQPLFADPSHAKVNENPEVRPQIAFNEVGLCEEEPLIAQLATLLHWVTGITLDCRRFL